MSVPSSIAQPFDLTRAFSIEKNADQAPDPARLKVMAQEFEAMLLLQMVRQMRQSMLSEEDQEDGFGNETLTDTFDVEFARHLAKSGGIGLAKAIEAQMAKSQAAASPSGTPADPKGAPAATSVPAALQPMWPQSVVPQSVPAPTGLTRDAAAAFASPRASAAAGDAANGTIALNMPLDVDATSKFGWRDDPLHGRRKFHRGVDLRAAYGTDVSAAGDGTVTFAGERGSYGLLVVVEHGNGLETRYAHLASAGVRAGDRVQGGQAVGRVGSSGRSTGPHLHFEVLRDGQRLDPEQMTVRQTAGERLLQRRRTEALTDDGVEP